MQVPELLEILGFLFLDLRKFVKLDCVRQVNPLLFPSTLLSYSLNVPRVCANHSMQWDIGAPSQAAAAMLHPGVYLNPSIWYVCVQTNAGGLYGKVSTNVFAMPGVLFGLCVLLYFNQRRTIGAVIAAGGADESAYQTAAVTLKQNIFFAIFLLCKYHNVTL